MSKYNFKNLIEDFGEAYKARRKDLLHNIQNRNMLSMHLGGIVIECYLKDLIVKKYNLKKARRKYWYDIDLYNSLEAQNGLSNKELTKDARKNHGHNILDLITDHLKELDDIMPMTVKSKFQNIEDPLRKSVENKRISSYIDIRYHGDDKFSKEEFKSWLEDFKFILNWLDENVSLVEVV